MCISNKIAGQSGTSDTSSAIDNISPSTENVNGKFSLSESEIKEKSSIRKMEHQFQYGVKMKKESEVG